MDFAAMLRHYHCMTTRFALFAIPFLLALTAAAPARRVAVPPSPAPMADTVRVTMTTELGSFDVEVDAKHAPITSANFLRYVDQRRFDGIVFYRSMHLSWGTPPNGLIQTGVQGNPKRVLRPIAHEPTSTTGISHKAGTLSMARYAPGTATGDFSILLSDMEGLDADPRSADPELAAGYAAFGHVVSGMDVVRRIWDAPRSETKGDGVMRGQMIERPVRVLTVRRVPMPPASNAALPARE
jgi:peptidyl-prolyl cis-trans isomerase A (cyclophilin A)